MVEPSPTGSKNLLPNRRREWEWERRAGWLWVYFTGHSAF
jgi:hypothetical protein